MIKSKNDFKNTDSLLHLSAKKYDSYCAEKVKKDDHKHNKNYVSAKDLTKSYAF